MPVLGPLTYRRGSTSNLLWVFLRDADEALRPRTGLTHDAAGATVAFVREDTLLPTRVGLRPATLGRHTAGGFIEADASSMPGVYEFGSPDEMFAEGSSQALVLFRFPGAAPEATRIDLVVHDPWDPIAVGIGGLGDRRRHAFLRGAMPGATTESLLDGERLELRLTQRLASSDGWGGGRWSGLVP
ncbi:MAG TPA: hypothetical protein VF986_03500 [Actinomycetota bacterium]